MRTLHVFLVVCICCAASHFNSVTANSTMSMTSMTSDATTASTPTTMAPTTSQTTMNSTSGHTTTPAPTGTTKHQSGGSFLRWSIYTMFFAVVVNLYIK